MYYRFVRFRTMLVSPPQIAGERSPVTRQRSGSEIFTPLNSIIDTILILNRYKKKRKYVVAQKTWFSHSHGMCPCSNEDIVRDQ